MKKFYKVAIVISSIFLLIFLSSCKEESSSTKTEPSQSISSYTEESSSSSSISSVPEPIEIDLSQVEFLSETFIYDGSEHELLLSGDIPSTVTVIYSNNTLTNSGTIIATARFEVSDLYVQPEPLIASITVEKRTINPDDFLFCDKTFVYDGTIKSLSVCENIPEGIEVTYSNNNNILAGSYSVTANFEVNDNYNSIAPITKTLTIEKNTYMDFTKILEDKTVPYDGNTHSLDFIVELPLGVTYTIKNNFNNVNAGIYNVEVNFFGDINYNPISSINATLTIEKLTFDTNLLEFSDTSIDYDGLSHTINILNSSVLPTENLFYTKTYNSLTDPGSIDVIFTFKYLKYQNYNLPESITKTLTVNKLVFDVSTVSFPSVEKFYTGLEYQLQITSTLPEGVFVNYTENKLTEIGSINVTASFDLPSYYIENNDTIEATLSVRKAKLDDFYGVGGELGFTFNDLYISYSNEVVALEITGTLPSGVSVTYSDNLSDTLGIKEVVVTFEVDEIHYESFESVSATLETYLSIPNVSFVDGTLVWETVYGASYYNIYVNDEFYASTYELSYSDFSDLENEQYVIYITAVSDEFESELIEIIINIENE